MAQPTDSSRIPYQPLHFSVRPKLDEGYVDFHETHIQFEKPEEEWHPGSRTSSSWLGQACSAPVKVGSAKDIDIGKFKVRVYKPEGIRQTGWPALLWLHGGGWVKGDLDSEEHICTQICRGADCIVISVGYRLAPENRYPVAVEDCFDALDWLVKRGPVEIGIDSKRVIVAGISAGGNLAAATSFNACKAEPPIKLLLQVLIVPVCDNTATPKSETWQQRPHAPVLTMDRMMFFQKLYLGDRNSPSWAGKEWAASPLLAPLQLLRRCPPTVIIVAEQDLLRAESFQFAQRLQESGVHVHVQEYPKAPHMFMSMDMVLESGRQAVEYLVGTVRRALAENRETGLRDPNI